MPRFVPGHLKTKKMCKHAVKKLPFVIFYWSIQDSKNVWWSEENQQICNNIVDKYFHALEFVPDCYITQNL